MHSRGFIVLRGTAFHVFMIFGAFLLIAPVLWMLSASFMTREDILSTPINYIPPTWRPENYEDIFVRFNLGRFLLNSVVVTSAVVTLNVLLSSCVGYSLAKFRYPGRNILFLLMLSTIMVPFTVIMIPLFTLLRELNWINTYQGLIAPFALSGLGVFLMRQFMVSIPDSYIEAARIDGASELGIFLRIILPMSRPAMVTLAIFTYITNWDEFLWPLIITTGEDYRTLPIGLSKFLEQYSNQWHLLMAGATVAALPVLIAFFLMQRKFLESGGGLSGLKG